MLFVSEQRACKCRQICCGITICGSCAYKLPGSVGSGGPRFEQKSNYTSVNSNILSEP
jgi:hypothetical protein